MKLAHRPLRTSQTGIRNEDHGMELLLRCLESFISSEAKESTLPVVSYREVKESLIVYLISLLIIATYSLLRVFNGGSDRICLSY